VNAAARDTIQAQLTIIEKRLGHDEAEVRDREGSIVNFKRRVNEQRQVVAELKEVLEEES
jgi:hypothetical protein